MLFGFVLLVNMEKSHEVNIRKRKRNEENIETEKVTKNNYMLRSKKSVRKSIPFDEKKESKLKKKDIPESHASSKTKRNGKSSKIQLLERMRTEVPAKEYLINEIVLATIPGYKPWPARILEISGQTIVVEFFGTGQMQVALLTKIVLLVILIK